MVDDHYIVSVGLRMLIQRRINGINLEACDTFEKFRGHFMQRLDDFDLVILDLKMPGNDNPISFLEDLINNHNNLNILIFSMYPEDLFAQKLYKLGIKAYVNKHSDDTIILSAIERALSGEHYFSNTYKNWLAEYSLSGNKNSILDSLSPREVDVLLLILEGYGSKEIGEKMHLHISSITTYKRRIFDKYRVNNVIELYKKVETITPGLLY